MIENFVATFYWNRITFKKTFIDSKRYFIAQNLQLFLFFLLIRLKSDISYETQPLGYGFVMLSAGPKPG